jgi:2-keto-4-pentenoate hydratase
MSVPDKKLAMIADEVFGMMVEPGEVQPFTDRFAAFGLEDAYQIVNEIRRQREARGERVVGRKIGFTNAAAWSGYGISGPIWNYLYDTTTIELPPSGGTFRLATWPNVRVETEVALGLCKAPEPNMGDDDLLGCIDWAALDFEICTSIFPGWRSRWPMPRRRECMSHCCLASDVPSARLQNAGGANSRTFLPRFLRRRGFVRQAEAHRFSAAQSRRSDMLYGNLRGSAESRFARGNS